MNESTMTTTPAPVAELKDASPWRDDPVELRRLADEQGYLFFRGLLAEADVLRVREQLLAVLDRHGLRDEYRTAKALLFPGIEDFGITPVEALGCGCPVIARKAGGALDWMAPQCGRFFIEPTPEALTRVIDEFQSGPDIADPSDCRENALRFRPEVFDAAILRIV